VVERCDAPRRVALPTVMSISPTRLIDYAKTWRDREATSRQRCCRIVFVFVSDSMGSPSIPSLPTIMPRPANRPCANASPLDAHTQKRRSKLARRRSMIGRPPTKSTIDFRRCWQRCCRQRCLAQGRGELCGAGIFFAHTRFIQEGRSPLLGTSWVFRRTPQRN
jgi:hypothetical protein